MKKKITEQNEDGTLQASQVESQESAEAPVAETKANSDALCVVIPFAKKYYSSDALKLAIRSWCENLIGLNFRMVVIGDKEDWFSDELLYVPMTVAHVSKVELHWQAACAALLVEGMSAGFVLAEPDTFVVNKIGYAHLILPKCKGIDTDGLINYSTGLPIRIFQEELVDFVEDLGDDVPNADFFNAFQRFASLTYPIELDWKYDVWLLPVVSKQPDVKRFENLVSKKCFMKAIDAGWSPFLEGFLEDMFPYKTIYEK